jgi:hypothetical protein
MEDEPASNAHASGSDVAHHSQARNRQLRGSLRNLPAIDSTRNTTMLPSTIDTAVIHLTIAVRAAKLKAGDALEIAISALKNLKITTLMAAAMEWIRLHPWETAALIVPVVLMACTPALLGLAGFTAGGIAAGLSL